MMGSLPTCWYCPECGEGPAPRGFKHLRGDDGSDTICPGTHVKCVVILPGTPLTDILDALGHMNDVKLVVEAAEQRSRSVSADDADRITAAIDRLLHPATGEAQDG